MKTYLKLFILTAFIGMSACTSETPEIKSPCVGIEGSPCERRNPSLQNA